ncbi:hypothetical protein E2P81_ATG03977 [Venturia nashicola]|uniref:Uncharacterized protein n=1 Tax=Venturia nashicola TaxID=86259 RepID=A0A4Z1P9M0_9PEZI|nr:hypothetical protein E6O75_ATG04073 [Venturia nashicola]TLD37165.1 hypothetical protein E2P81_ATG03977 [Venturia nashicola]
MPQSLARPSSLPSLAAPDLVQANRYRINCTILKTTLYFIINKYNMDWAHYKHSKARFGKGEPSLDDIPKTIILDLKRDIESARKFLKNFLVKRDLEQLCFTIDNSCYREMSDMKKPLQKLSRELGKTENRKDHKANDMTSVILDLARIYTVWRKEAFLTLNDTGETHFLFNKICDDSYAQQLKVHRNKDTARADGRSARGYEMESPSDSIRAYGILELPTIFPIEEEWGWPELPPDDSQLKG